MGEVNKEFIVLYQTVQCRAVEKSAEHCKEGVVVQLRGQQCRRRGGVEGHERWWIASTDGNRHVLHHHPLVFLHDHHHKVINEESPSLYSISVPVFTTIRWQDRN